MPETELLIKKSGDSIVLTPMKTTGWKNVRAAIAMFKGPLERQQLKDFYKRNRRA